MIKMSLFVLLVVISTCFQLTAQTSQVISLNFNKEKIEKKSNINNYQFDYQSNLYNGRLYRFITFEKVPNVELLKKLSDKDIQMLEYIPNNTYDIVMIGSTMYHLPTPPLFLNNFTPNFIFTPNF